MIKFIIKRLVALIPVLIGVSLLVFFILDLAPGDPAKTILGEQARPEDIAGVMVKRMTPEGKVWDCSSGTWKSFSSLWRRLLPVRRLLLAVLRRILR